MTTSAIHGVVPDYRGDWRDMAACRGMDTNRWYPEDIAGRTEKDKNLRGIIRREAIAVCRTCPVQIECLDDALARDSGTKFGTFGIRGALTPSERIRVAKRRKS